MNLGWILVKRKKKCEFEDNLLIRYLNMGCILDDTDLNFLGVVHFIGEC